MMLQFRNREKQILAGSYSPVGRGRAFLSHPAASAAAVRHSKTPSQIVLRWHTQQGITTVTKSADPRRQLENLEIFDFELTPKKFTAYMPSTPEDRPASIQMNTH
jgi:diketogulonate reductase-like aldo/keto reductase